MTNKRLELGRVVLSGASGMLGTAIATVLIKQRIGVLKLVRREAAGEQEVWWNPVEGGGLTDPLRLEGVAGAVHLSGANVTNRRWSDSYKREMRESRVSSTRIFSEALARLKTPPEVLIAASATGFYGNRGDEVLDEDSAPGEGFFPELCEEWEAASKAAEDAGIRVVHLRFGIVIGRDGGALGKMVPMFRLGLGGPLGNGRQWMSWISETDVVGAVLFALENRGLRGIVNAVAPKSITNAEFTRELGLAVHRPAVLPAPAFALRLVLGEMADEALLASTRVVPKRLLTAGFEFAYPSIAGALAKALGTEKR